MLFIYNNGWLLSAARCSESEIKNIVAKAVNETDGEGVSISYHYE